MKIEWQTIDGYPAYEVSNSGTVRNKLTGRILKNKGHNAGYLCVNLYKAKGHPDSFLIHRLVAMAFLPNIKSLPQVNHLDGNKHNNELGNLEWCTRSHNVNHAYGMVLVGGKTHHGKSTLSEEALAMIREKYIPKVYTQQMLANEFGISRSSVSAILRGVTWNNGQQGPTKAFTGQVQE